MGVEGSAYYEVFKQLNAKIIKPAVTEVNKTSNIILTPETKKQGRAVTHIRFLITENPQLAILDMDDGEGARHGAVYGRLRALGVSDRLARQWLSAHGEEVVSAKLDYVEARRNVVSKVGYLSAALDGDFGTPDPVTVEPPNPQAERLRRILEVIRQRTPTQRDADRRLFLSQLTDRAARADFERHGWMSPLNAARIGAFWEDMSPGLFG